MAFGPIQDRRQAKAGITRPGGYIGPEGAADIYDTHHFLHKIYRSPIVIQITDK
jgi:hypothetical protein